MFGSNYDLLLKNNVLVRNSSHYLLIQTSNLQLLFSNEIVDVSLVLSIYYKVFKRLKLIDLHTTITFTYITFKYFVNCQEIFSTDTHIKKSNIHFNKRDRFN